MIAGVPQETFPGERRVALIPGAVPSLAKAGFTVIVQSGAGAEAGFPDAAYLQKGAEIVSSRAEVFERSDVLLQVRLLGANAAAGRADLGLMRPGQVLIGFANRWRSRKRFGRLPEGRYRFLHGTHAAHYPRPGMDALSSMATVAVIRRY